MRYRLYIRALLPEVCEAFGELGGDGVALVRVARKAFPDAALAFVPGGVS
jgi:hypothetical protein